VQVGTHEYWASQAGLLLGVVRRRRRRRRAGSGEVVVVPAERREMKQLFHRRAGIESQSPQSLR
jgi:hypothetical protein